MIVAKVRPAPHRLGDGFYNFGGRVPQEQGTITEQEVDVLVAIDIPLAAASPPLDVERHRRCVAQVVSHLAAERFAGADKVLLRPGALRSVGRVYFAVHCHTFLPTTVRRRR